MRFGLHVSASGGLISCADRAKELGCETFQIFPSNPRGWGQVPIEPGEMDLFRRKLREHDLRPLVVHATYLVNLASPRREVWDKSLAAAIGQMRRTAALGGAYYVTHAGSHLGSGFEAGAERFALAARRALDEVTGPMLLLENTAGTKNGMGATIEDLAAIADRIDAPGRVGLCLDTAHALAAGYDVAEDTALSELFAAIEKLFGPDRLKVVHANDSKYPLGARGDRHEHIGKGEIGREGFKVFLKRSEVAELPMILETPVDREGDDLRNLRAIRRLAPGPKRKGSG